MKLHAVWKYWCFITFMKLISKVGIIPFNISFQSTEVGWWDLNKSNGIFFFQCEPAELPQSKMSWETWLWTRETRRGNAFILLHVLEKIIFLFCGNNAKRWSYLSYRFNHLASWYLYLHCVLQSCPVLLLAGDL